MNGQVIGAVKVLGSVQFSSVRDRRAFLKHKHHSCHQFDRTAYFSHKCHHFKRFNVNQSGSFWLKCHPFKHYPLYKSLSILHLGFMRTHILRMPFLNVSPYKRFLLPYLQSQNGKKRWRKWRKKSPGRRRSVLGSWTLAPPAVGPQPKGKRGKRKNTQKSEGGTAGSAP